MLTTDPGSKARSAKTVTMKVKKAPEITLPLLEVNMSTAFLQANFNLVISFILGPLRNLHLDKNRGLLQDLALKIVRHLNSLSSELIKMAIVIKDAVETRAYPRRIVR